VSAYGGFVLHKETVVAEKTKEKQFVLWQTLLAEKRNERVIPARSRRERIFGERRRGVDATVVSRVKKKEQ